MTFLAGGWLALFIALVSPLHAWGRVLFSAHMSQHECLMLVAAPLLVLGRPLIAFLWALPLNWSRRLGNVAKIRSGFASTPSSYKLKYDQPSRSFTRGFRRTLARQRPDRVAGSVVSVPAIYVTIG